MISPERLELMQQTWVRQLARFEVAPGDAYPPFDDLVARYQEPHRYYHNLEHIGEVLKVIAKLSDLANDPGSLFLAAWYHDAIYDPRAKDNEARSAELAVAHLTPLGLARELLDKITALILATSHMQSTSTETDICILLDADLAILGAEEKRYRRYAEDIRREYAWVDAEAYRVGRSAVLEGFLKRERIYRTDRMFAEGEEAARYNLRTELS